MGGEKGMCLHVVQYLTLFFDSGEEWSQEAADLVFQLSQGRVLQAQVAGYTVDGLPEVFLYATLGPDVSGTVTDQSVRMEMNFLFLSLLSLAEHCFY